MPGFNPSPVYFILWNNNMANAQNTIPFFILFIFSGMLKVLSTVTQFPSYIPICEVSAGKFKYLFIMNKIPYFDP